MHLFLIFFLLHFFDGFLAVFLAHLVLAHAPDLSKRLKHPSMAQNESSGSQPLKGFGLHAPASVTQTWAVELLAPSM